MRILIKALFLLTTLFFVPYCFSASIPEMQVYCTTTAPKVSFPFPGQPEIYNNPEFKESYLCKDMTNINSYQFYYKKFDKIFNSKAYLDGVITGRLRSLKATLLDKKIFKSGGKTIAIYSYYYYSGNTKKLSYVKAVIAKDIYYSWAVQSYEGSSAYSADNIFANYSKYVDNGKGFCK